MKKRVLALVCGIGAALCTVEASAYGPCWTSYFNPGDYPVAYDAYGLRYINALPEGTTCGCTVNTNQIWISGVDRRGTTAATLAAAAAGKQVRFYLQDEGDGYCRSTIVEVKPN